MAKRALDLSNKLACAIRDDEAAITLSFPSFVKMVYYGPQYNGLLDYIVLVITGHICAILHWLYYPWHAIHVVTSMDLQGGREVHMCIISVLVEIESNRG